MEHNVETPEVYSRRTYSGAKDTAQRNEMDGNQCRNTNWVPEALGDLLFLFNRRTRCSDSPGRQTSSIRSASWVSRP